MYFIHGPPVFSILGGDEYNGHPVSAGYFGAYSMDALALALHCVYHTTGFDEGTSSTTTILG